MNRVILMGRLTRDPIVRYTQSANGSLAIARYTLAVDRRRRSSGNDQQTADFISCVTFGRQAEFAEKYLHQGTKICVQGRIQTGSYTNKDGNKVYTTDVIVDDQEFAESKNAAASHTGSYQAAPAPSKEGAAPAPDNGFMNVPAGTDDDMQGEDLPFA
ncbi:MAG: single-stranded DNA-binding protein [Lachnospiraceae bacterium]|jgi:single-strand DNA-binding protein